MSYTGSRGYTYTQRTTIIHHRESSPRDSQHSYETRSSDYYSGSNSNMSGRSSSSGQGYGSRGSGGEQSVKYRDSAADKKYIEGKTSRSGHNHVINHGDSHKHYDPAEPRAGEGRESDYNSARYERHEREKLRTSVSRR
ncbi:hypothetical protein BELL_1612g00020 [Botrytis elliptica]|uniref:Uncharacterized protein n=1 Tax=Botrytis elliptica TaxID=278938 RepID=A0A4Z1HVE6_9HELO|nr:hypothetical protein EAE99_005668 [Botrytis elliptica]TGO53056.1 hypothetical protein BELL_1612g00020 [Botrytis elliptica]